MLQALPGLDIRIIPGPDRSHGRGLIASIALSGILEVTVRAAWTIDANVARGGNVRTPMRLRHDCHYGNAAGRAGGLSLQKWHDALFILYRDRSYYVRHFRDRVQFILARGLTLQLCQVYALVMLVRIY